MSKACLPARRARLEGGTTSGGWYLYCFIFFTGLLFDSSQARLVTKLAGGGVCWALGVLMGVMFCLNFIDVTSQACGWGDWISGYWCFLVFTIEIFCYATTSAEIGSLLLAGVV